MAEFDEYEYLEKTVEADNNRNGDGEKKERRRDREDEPEEDRKIKRNRSDDENGSGERKREDKERERSSRHRGGERESVERSSRSERHRSVGDREKDGDKDRERDRDRERRRSSRDDVDKEKERSSKDRDREKERRDREKEKEKERERREREREKEKERERERERSRRSRSRSRLEREERDRELEIRESRRFKDKKEVVEPEADPERDQRTVFAYQMPLKATERNVYEFFSQAGKVRDVRLIMDRNSRRSKGVGYIEFYDVMSVPMAIALSGQHLLGQPVMIKPSEAEKNLVQSSASGGGAGVAGPYGAVDRKLYVGNLHFNMTELQLKQLFEAFGPVELVQLPTDENGQCKGFGFVQFAQLEHAKAAQSLNGTLEIAGRMLKVSSVTDHVVSQDTGAKAADFDDDEGGGLALNAQSRAMLMQKLDRSGTASSVVGPLGAPLLNGSAAIQTSAFPVTPAAVPIPAIAPPYLAPMMVQEPIGKPSECLLLKNMFDPATEVEPDFDLDIRDDVHDECSKYGEVKHIYVDKESAGYVYLRFENVEAASRAQQAMHQRWFAQKLISAIFLQRYEYDAKFKRAA